MYERHLERLHWTIYREVEGLSRSIAVPLETAADFNLDT